MLLEEENLGQFLAACPLQSLSSAPRAAAEPRTKHFGARLCFLGRAPSAGAGGHLPVILQDPRAPREALRDSARRSPSRKLGARRQTSAKMPARILPLLPHRSPTKSLFALGISARSLGLLAPFSWRRILSTPGTTSCCFTPLPKSQTGSEQPKTARGDTGDTGTRTVGCAVAPRCLLVPSVPSGEPARGHLLPIRGRLM